MINKKKSFKYIILIPYISFICFSVVLFFLIDRIVKSNKTTPLCREDINVEDYIDELLLLKEDAWCNLNDKQQLHVLQTIADIETYKDGMTDYPQVTVKSLPDPLGGCYDPARNEVIIDEDVFFTSSSRELVAIVLHECRHHLTTELADAYRSLPKQYKEMEVFSIYRQYAYEYENYIDINDDYKGYYNQSVEKESRYYSERQTDRYFEYINNYGVSNQ